MNHRRLLALGLLLLAPLPVTWAQSPWRVGERAPHLHLPRIEDGAAVDLADLVGRRVHLIEFASW